MLDLTDDLGRGSPISKVKQKPDYHELRESREARERENRPTFSRRFQEVKNGYIVTLLQSTKLGFK